MLIKQDATSIGLTVLAASVLIFLATFGADLMLRALFSFSLLIGGIFLSLIVGKYGVDETFDQGEMIQSLRWVLITLGVTALLATVVPKIPLNIDTSTLSVTDAFVVPRMFGILIAVSEEQFFRGFATNFFAGRLGMSAGVIASGIFFGLYHTAVYGTSVSLMLYVMGAGIIMSYAALRTGRVSTTMISHVLINMFAGA